MRCQVQDLVGRCSGLRVVLVEEPPSTSAQRNRGVRDSSADVVHFVDDDTELDPTYLEEILAVFRTSQPNGPSPAPVLGVGGVARSPRLPGRRRSRLMRRLYPPGRVLASGRAILPVDIDELTEVDWLSGCSMSFMRDAVVHEPFDESAGGYVLGEDLDLGYRIRQRGRLLVNPRATLDHHESPVNRWPPRRWAETDVVNRHRRVRSRVGRYRPLWFWVDTVAQLLWWGGRSLRGSGYARDMTRGIASGLLISAGIRRTQLEPRSAP
jgi:GT2 family glycosyltransferase